ncbi:MAG: VWA domain-containing protein [Myxococcota bacterium]
MNKKDRLTRWRLILGAESSETLGVGLDGEAGAMDVALGFLYDRESQQKNVRGGPGSLEDSQLTVPEWINQIHELFPKKTIERLEKDALERYQLNEMVTNTDVLRRVKPNMTLLKSVLRTKHLMNQEVLAEARRLIRRVVSDLLERLARPIRSPFFGTVDPRQRSPLKVAKNFDAMTTIRRNLKRYDPERRKIFIETPYFFSRVRRHIDRWQIIIVVDQSGSMLDSVIHSAVTASIFWGLRDIRTHLVLFDTNVVDVTKDCSDPVETLMKVQLGGGTDIGQALAYASTLVETPRRAIVVLITDFYEGASEAQLLNATQALVASGTTLLGLAALDELANPNYDRNLAQRMVNLGAHVAAMTPGELAQWVAEKVK